MTKFWIKLNHKILDDIKFCLLPEFVKWRAIELFLVAGENGNDGLLPPVERLAWRLRLPLEKLVETLAVLSQVGVVHETPEGWVVTDFEKSQEALSSTERSRSFRRRNEHATKSSNKCNEGGGVDSISTSTSDSIFKYDSDSESDSEGIGVHTQTTPKDRGQAGAGGEGGLITELASSATQVAETADGGLSHGDASQVPPQPVPTTPAEAMVHPDVQVYTAATGGRIPGLSQYRTVIDSVRFLRKREKLGDHALAAYLTPYWLAWTSRKRQDGRPYDPGNITWLAEWAMNKSIPPPGGQKAVESARPAAPSVEETRRMLAEKDKQLKKAVPPPQDVRAKMNDLKKQLEGKEGRGKT